MSQHLSKVAVIWGNQGKGKTAPAKPPCRPSRAGTGNGPARLRVLVSHALIRLRRQTDSSVQMFALSAGLPAGWPVSGRSRCAQVARLPIIDVDCSCCPSAAHTADRGGETTCARAVLRTDRRICAVGQADVRHTGYSQYKSVEGVGLWTRIFSAISRHLPSS